MVFQDTASGSTTEFYFTSSLRILYDEYYRCKEGESSTTG